MLNVKDFGAQGVAVPAEELRLTHHHFKWLVHAAGTRATVYRARIGEA